MGVSQNLDSKTHLTKTMTQPETMYIDNLLCYYENHSE